LMFGTVAAIFFSFSLQDAMIRISAIDTLKNMLGLMFVNTILHC
jgi:hypothetical protein